MPHNISDQLIVSADDYGNKTLDNSMNGTLDMEELLRLLRERHKKPLSAEDFMRNAIIILCYSVIIVVSLCGNCLVIKVIAFGKKKMLTTTNILIASLAVSDIVMTAFNIPFNVARLLMDTWPFGAFMCVSVPFVQVTCVYVSTFTMTVIAFYRYWTLSSQTSTKSLTYYQLAIILAIVWLLAALLSVPHCIFNETIVVPTIHNLVRCQVIHPPMSIDLQLWLSVEALTTQYFIPLSFTIWLYIKIGMVVAKQGLIAGHSNDERRRQTAEARKKRIVMLALVVTTFAICWLPLNLYHLLCDFHLISRNFKIFILCHWFAMSSVCYNPFIYCYLNQSFKNAAKKLFYRVTCKRRSNTMRHTVGADAVTVEEPTNYTNVNNIEMKCVNNIDDEVSARCDQNSDDS